MNSNLSKDIDNIIERLQSRVGDYDKMQDVIKSLQYWQKRCEASENALIKHIDNKSEMQKLKAVHAWLEIKKEVL